MRKMQNLFEFCYLFPGIDTPLTRRGARIKKNVHLPCYEGLVTKHVNATYLAPIWKPLLREKKSFEWGFLGKFAVKK